MHSQSNWEVSQIDWLGFIKLNLRQKGIFLEICNQYGSRKLNWNRILFPIFPNVSAAAEHLLEFWFHSSGPISPLGSCNKDRLKASTVHTLFCQKLHPTVEERANILYFLKFQAFSGRIYATGNPQACFELGNGASEMTLRIPIGTQCGTVQSGRGRYVNHVVIQANPVIMQVKKNRITYLKCNTFFVSV